MHRKQALDLDARRAFGCNCALDILRRENDVRVFWAFQNVLVHSLVATVAAALAAGGIHNELASGIARSIVKLYAAALQPEVSMNSMERGVHSKVDFGLRWIERKRFLLGLRGAGREHPGENEKSNAS